MFTNRLKLDVQTRIVHTNGALPACYTVRRVGDAASRYEKPESRIVVGLPFVSLLGGGRGVVSAILTRDIPLAYVLRRLH